RAGDQQDAGGVEQQLGADQDEDGVAPGQQPVDADAGEGGRQDDGADEVEGRALERHGDLAGHGSSSGVDGTASSSVREMAMAATRAASSRTLSSSNGSSQP